MEWGQSEDRLWGLERDWVARVSAEPSDGESGGASRIQISGVLVRPSVLPAPSRLPGKAVSSFLRFSEGLLTPPR